MSKQLQEEQKQFVDVKDMNEVPGGKMKHLLLINCDMRTISSAHSEHKDILPKEIIERKTFNPYCMNNR